MKYFLKKHQKNHFWIFLWWLFLSVFAIILIENQTKFTLQKQNENYLQNEFFSQTGTIQTISNQTEESEWNLSIPKIQVDQKILEGTSQEVLKEAIGHFSETTSWEGNVGLAAHNRNGGKAGFFGDLFKLETGDEIIYTKNGQSRTYQVVRNDIIAETDWSSLETTTENQITLITCEAGMREYRRCVQAYEKEEIK